MTTCSEEDCENEVKARGVCQKHYTRLWRGMSGPAQEDHRAYSRRRDAAYRELAKRHRAEMFQILRALEMQERRDRLREEEGRLLAERKAQ